MKYSAAFSNGITVTRTRPGPVSHGWYANGTLRNGRKWQMNGFSAKGAEQAASNMHTDVRHIERQGGTIDFSEVVEVTVADEMVPA